MDLAIAEGERGIASGQTPFGSVVVSGSEPISLAHNRVYADRDITAHAEILAIRRACAHVERIDLTGCTIYSTCEPCPMCFSAIHWARIGRNVYGASIGDAREAGFHAMPIAHETMAELGGTAVVTEGRFRTDECIALFRSWKETGSLLPY